MHTRDKKEKYAPPDDERRKHHNLTQPNMHSTVPNDPHFEVRHTVCRLIQLAACRRYLAYLRWYTMIGEEQSPNWWCWGALLFSFCCPPLGAHQESSAHRYIRKERRESFFLAPSAFITRSAAPHLQPNQIQQMPWTFIYKPKVEGSQGWDRGNSPLGFFTKLDSRERLEGLGWALIALVFTFEAYFIT